MPQDFLSVEALKKRELGLLLVRDPLPTTNWETVYQIYFPELLAGMTITRSDGDTTEAVLPDGNTLAFQTMIGTGVVDETGMYSTGTHIWAYLPDIKAEPEYLYEITTEWSGTSAGQRQYSGWYKTTPTFYYGGRDTGSTKVFGAAEEANGADAMHLVHSLRWETDKPGVSLVNSTNGSGTLDYQSSWPEVLNESGKIWSGEIENQTRPDPSSENWHPSFQIIGTAYKWVGATIRRMSLAY